MDALTLIHSVDNARDNITLPEFIVNFHPSEGRIPFDTIGGLPIESPTVSTDLKVPKLVTIRIIQCDSIHSSTYAFIARQYSKIPAAIAVYKERVDDLVYFYVLLAEDDEEAMDSAFDVERFVYSRFAGEQFDFCVLPGKELSDQIPTGANLVWKR
jgi:hypothetical protein